MVICLERVADLHMPQLISLPLTVCCFSKIQIAFSFLVPAHPGSPGKRAVKRVCVCVSLVKFMHKFANRSVLVMIVSTVLCCSLYTMQCDECGVLFNFYILFMQVLHLETSNSAMAEDLLSKTAIIEHYVMETKSGISSLLYDAVHCIFSTHTHPFNGPFSRTTRVGRYQKGKTNLDFTEARDSE